MKKFISLISALLLTFGVNAMAYTDVSEKDWFFEAVNTATEKAWFSGYDDDTFKPDNTILRSEAAKVLVAYKYGEELPEADSNTYSDITGNEWYAQYVNVCADENIIPVKDGAFEATVPITRQDAMYAMAVVLGLDTQGVDLEILDTFTDQGDISDYAKGAVAASVSKGIVSGFDDNTVKPLETITRAQFATIMTNVENMENEPEETASPKASEEPTAAPESTAVPVDEENAGKNLFDGKCSANMAIMKDGEEWTEKENNSYYLSGFQKVSPLQSYFVALYNPVTMQYEHQVKSYAFYNSNREMIDAGYFEKKMLVTAPENAAYMKISILKKSDFDASRIMYRTVIINTDTAPEEFIPASEPISDAFADKKVCIIGDMVMASSNNFAWVKDIEKNLFYNNVNILRKSTYSYINLTNSINSNDVLDKIEADTDYIIVACGTYDWKACTYVSIMEGLGELGDTNEMTVYGAVNAFVDRVQQKYPNAELILVTPPNFSYAGELFTESGFVNVHSFSTQSVAEAIKEIASEKNVSVIDLNTKCWTRDNISQYVNYDDYSYLNMNVEGIKLVNDIMTQELLKIAE